MSSKVKNKHLIAKLVGGSLLTGLFIYVFNEVRKEYDSTVEENNYLKDFIENHDFYKKEELPKSGTQKSQNKTDSQGCNCKSNFKLVTREPTISYKLDNGMIVNSYLDPKSGFSLIKYEKIKQCEEKQ